MTGAGLILLVAVAAGGEKGSAGIGAATLKGFGWAWPLTVLALLAGGVYLVWPERPRVRRFDVAAAAVGGLGLTGLLGAFARGGAVGRVIDGAAAARLGAWGAGLLLLVIFLLGLVVVARFSPGAILGGVLAAARAGYAERERLNRLVRRAAPEPAPPRPSEPAVPEPALAGPGRADTAETLPAFVEGDPDRSAEPARGSPAPRFEGDFDRDGAALVRVVADPEDDEPVVDWKLPPLALLDTVGVRQNRMQEEIKRNVRVIEQTLDTFGVSARVIGVNPGPAVTQYELQPAAGVQVKRITSLTNDLSLALAAAPLRIEAPIPGKSAVGIEVPNRSASMVSLREVVDSAGFRAAAHIPLALGNDVSGQPISTDLTRMPHLLIAGATGQGKSVCINVLISSLLLRQTPADLRLILIDPKRVELSGYNGLPHLAVPVIVEPHQAAAALRWCVAEMDRRYKVLSAEGVRNIQSYNEHAATVNARRLPYLVIVIDELADLMMVSAGEIEELVCRIAQLARAVGIHLVIATQRPSTDIITGLIKANIPSRIAFAVGSQVDSRVILDSVGAEKLLGRGDMLYQPVDAGKPVRLQGAFVHDREVEGLVSHWRRQGDPRFIEEVLEDAPTGLLEGGGERKLDPLFPRAARAVAAEGAASVSLVQRKFNVGYSRAGRIVDQLAENRVVGAYQGSKSREVLMNLPDVDELLENLGIE
ncbi:MAG: DNA translocase FtsK [Candidatus Dormibacterales bacterium]